MASGDGGARKQYIRHTDVIGQLLLHNNLPEVSDLTHNHLLTRVSAVWPGISRVALPQVWRLRSWVVQDSPVHRSCGSRVVGWEALVFLRAERLGV